jgi:hypothetical protein
MQVYNTNVCTQAMLRWAKGGENHDNNECYTQAEPGEKWRFSETCKPRLNSCHSLPLKPNNKMIRLNCCFFAVPYSQWQPYAEGAALPQC